MLAACQTSNHTKTSSIGAQGSRESRSDFDRHKAAETRLAAGLTYLRQGNLQFAKRHLDRAMELGVDSGNVHFGIAYYFEQVKEFKKAEKSYKRALKIEPKNPDFLNGYASFLCNKGQYKKADKYYNSAVNQPTYPDIASAYANAGVCAKRSGNVQRAAAYFRKALNRDDKLPIALVEMAEVEFSKERYTRADSYLKRFEEVSKPSANSLWLALRIAYFLKNQDARASYAIKLEQIFPDSDETALYLDSQSQWN